MHYLLFLPHKSAANPQNLHDVGLGALLRPDDDQPVFTDLVGPGPEGLPGQIVTWAPARTSYLPDQQEWFPAVPDPVRNLPAGRYWIGINRAQPPTIADLERRTVVPGIAKILADGTFWPVPSVMNLPCRIGLCPQTGRRLRTPKPEYDDWRQETELAFGLVQRLLSGGELPADLDERFELAVRLMQLNYRLTREIAVRFGPLRSDEHELQIVYNALDLTALHAALEAKKKADSPETDAASTPAAGPPA